MTDINAISRQKQSNISSSTKVKLESLGVNISTVSSESEAQELINKLKAAKAGTTQQAQETKQDEANTTSTSEAETLSSAKSLASSMGLVVASEATAEDIINQISTRIRQLATSSSQAEREMAQAYQTQLNSIATQYQSLQSNQTNMYSAMNMMSINNKYSLNL